MERRGEDNAAFQRRHNNDDDLDEVRLDSPDFGSRKQPRAEVNIDYSKPVSDDDHNEVRSERGIMQKFAEARDYPMQQLAKHPTATKSVIYGVIFILYNAYFIGCLVRYNKYDMAMEWCDEMGFLIIITCIVYAGLFYYQIVVRFFGKFLGEKVVDPLSRFLDRAYSNNLVSIITYLVVIAAFIVFLVIDSWGTPERLISGGGIIIIVAFGFVFSAHPGHVRWRPVIWGIGMQFVFGLLVLRWEVGRNIFQCLGDKVSIFLSYTDEGSAFVFGYLVHSQPFIPSNIEVPGDENATAALRLIAEAFNTPNANGGTPFDAVFMFKTLSVIYFFSFCVSMLFYVGALQWIVLKMGWLLYVTLGTTAAESLNAAANIFLGQTEAPLLIRPFMPIMTKSEIHAVMTGGFATIAGTVLAAYISFGIDAAQLISASVMAAPAALAFSKLFYPETEKSKTTIADIKLEKGTEANILDAAAQGASTAIMLVLNIAASLIAFLAFVGFLNGIIGWMGDLAGVDGISFEYLLGKIFIPVAFILGVPSQDCENVGKLIGLKTIINEFKAYQELGNMVAAGAISERAATIATFALCGFANPGSIGIQLGGLGALAPERKKDLAQVVFRAFISGCVASMLNACVAGALIA